MPQRPAVRARPDSTRRPRTCPSWGPRRRARDAWPRPTPAARPRAAPRPRPRGASPPPRPRRARLPSPPPGRRPPAAAPAGTPCRPVPRRPRKRSWARTARREGHASAGRRPRAEVPPPEAHGEELGGSEALPSASCGRAGVQVIPARARRRPRGGAPPRGGRGGPGPRPAPEGAPRREGESPALEMGTGDPAWGWWFCFYGSTIHVTSSLLSEQIR